MATEEEHAGHAAAVKLLGNKDYYVQLYIMFLDKFVGASGLKWSVEHGEFRSAGGQKAMNEAIRLADAYALGAIKNIDNYGETK